MERPSNKTARDSKPRSRSNPRSKQNNDDLSSVISDGFGAKSAYLEAIAMKAAVAGGSKKKKKRRSPGSDVSATTNNSKHSEKFQQFLDRRVSKDGGDVSQQSSSQLPDRKPPTGRSEVSSRAEKYASEKMDEMMDAMAGRTDNRGRTKEDYEETGAFPTFPSTTTTRASNEVQGGTNTNNNNDATRTAAEELAAARVEAMMQRLSALNLEDNEAEI